MTARLIRAAYVTRVYALLSGHGSRELLVEVRHGRPPLWSSRYRAWASTPEHVSDALALAEARNWATSVVEEEHMLALAGAELAEARGVLW